MHTNIQDCNFWYQKRNLTGMYKMYIWYINVNRYTGLYGIFGIGKDYYVSVQNEHTEFTIIYGKI